MKNLTLLTSINVWISKFGDEDVDWAIDSDTGRIYFISANYIVGVDPSLDEEIFSIVLEELAEGDIKVTGVQFLQGEESLCIATKHGDFLLVNVQKKSARRRLNFMALREKGAAVQKKETIEPALPWDDRKT